MLSPCALRMALHARLHCLRLCSRARRCLSMADLHDALRPCSARLCSMKTRAILVVCLLAACAIAADVPEPNVLAERTGLADPRRRAMCVCSRLVLARSRSPGPDKRRTISPTRYALRSHARPADDRSASAHATYAGTRRAALTPTGPARCVLPELPRLRDRLWRAHAPARRSVLRARA